MKRGEDDNLPEVVVPNLPETSEALQAPQFTHPENHAPQVAVQNSLGATKQVAYHGNYAPQVNPYTRAYTSSDDSPKEAFQYATPGDATPGDPSKEQRTCGLRRRTFWIVLIAAIIVIACAAIGGGVGGALANQSSDDESASNATDSSAPPSLPAGTTSGIRLTSKLATVNWTLGSIDYLRVYYQDDRGVIMQTGWDSGSQIWDVSEVTVPSNMKNTDGVTLDSDTQIDVRQDTPIAASNLHDEQNDFMINIFYLDSINMIRHIWSKSFDGPWVLQGNGILQAHQESHLAVFWLEGCDGACQHNTLVAFQAEDTSLQMLDMATWTEGIDLPITVPAGAPFAVAPFYAREGLRMYVNNGGNLVQLIYDGREGRGSRWNTQSTPQFGVDPSSQVAAMGTGVQGGDQMANYWVFYTRQRSSGGVGLLRGTNQGTAANPFTWGSSSTDQTFQDVAPNSAIAANQAGMIFAISSDGSKHTLVQWQLSAGGAVEKVAEVNTSLEGS